jgi:hypothetical protein
MSNDSPLAAPGQQVLIELLDPEYGHPVKTWKFVDKALITIGRSSDQDVEIADSYVSRTHAHLCLRGSEWFLISQGRNGVVLQNQLITEKAVGAATRFRLGANGPQLRFRATGGDADDPGALLSETRVACKTMPIPTFQLDQNKLNADVGAIVEDDFFQNLQQRARDLRKQRQSE